MSSKRDIAQCFGTRQINTRTNDTSWKGSRIFSSGDTIYSYGYHFPLAIFLGTENLGKPNQRHVFVKNGDKYSSSTSGHQSAVQSHCPGPTVARSALRAAGIVFDNLYIPPSKTFTPPPERKYNERSEKYGRIVFYRPDFRQAIYRERATGKLFENDIEYLDKDEKPVPYARPDQGMFIPHDGNSGRDPDSPVQYGSWHILGATVIEQDDKYYLCSLDESSYFVSQLSRRPKSIEDAFVSLKPKPVLDAEKAGRTVLRQGEWFFINTGVNDRQLSQNLGLRYGAFAEQTERRALPVRDIQDVDQENRATGQRSTGQQNLHEALLFTPDRKVTIGGVVIKAGHVLARGKVFHRFPNFGSRLTGQHKTLNLGEFWYSVHRNLEVAAWSQGGTFD